MKFLDRKEECERLAQFLAQPEGALACLYGRRRIGKSRLLEEVFAGRDDVLSYCADRSDAALQRARMATDFSRMLPGFDAVTYSDWRAFFERWQREAMPGSVLVIDEFPYLVEQSPELPSVLQYIADRLRTSGQKVIICGSSQRMMQGLVLDASEPLYGRCKAIIRLGPIGFEWLKKAFPKLTPIERLEYYATWGGVPRYWEICEGEDDFVRILRQNVFSVNGLFHEEPSFVLKDDLEDAAQATSVLALIGQGSERPAEMAARLQVPQTALARPLKRLVDLGLVYRDIPFDKEVKGNKKTLYKLDDYFLSFWYSFVLPHYSDSRFLTSDADRKAFRSSFRIFLGKVWEKLVRDMLLEKPVPGIEARWSKVGRWWGSGKNHEPMEVDVLAESSDGKSLLVGEAKLSLTAIEAAHEQAELVKKAALLPFASKYQNVICRLFVAENPVHGQIGLNWAEKL